MMGSEDQNSAFTCASLFIGRWAPFHKGHQALIESVLITGKPVVIAIRDTLPSRDNPYSTSERWVAIQNALHKWGSLVRIVVIPDIDEICYGRDVGYGIRQIEMASEIQEVSGTKKRLSARPSYEIIWLMGQSGSGKTTLADAIRRLIAGSVILDGDDMRESISDEGFAANDRHTHNLRVMRLAQVLSRQSTVIVSVIAPMEATRQVIDEMIRPIWVFCHRSQQKSGDEFPFESPQTVDVDADGDRFSVMENAERVIQFFLARCDAAAPRTTLGAS